MSIQTISPEVVIDEQKEMLAVVRQNALPEDAALSLQQSYAPLFTEARDVLTQSRSVVVTDASQKLQIKVAREYRLALRQIRIKGENARKALKDEGLRRGKAIDAFNTILLHMVQTEETRLQEQEDFIERQETARKEALKEVRAKILLGIQVNPALYQLAEMSEETFANLVEGTKLARAAELDRKRKEEADRIEREAKAEAERQRIRAENERLKREADEREAAAKLERERLAAELHSANEKARQEREAAEATAAEERRRVKAEREAAEKARREELAAIEAQRAKERAEFEEKAKREAAEVAEAARKERVRLQEIAEIERKKTEAARAAAETAAFNERVKREQLEEEARAAKVAELERIAAEQQARQKAAAAPDRVKLRAYASAIHCVNLPICSTVDAQTAVSLIEAKRDEFARFIEAQASQLGVDLFAFGETKTGEAA